jgi:hypothetical protein
VHQRHTDSDSDSDSDANADSNANANANADSDSDSDSDSDANADSNANANADSDSDAHWVVHELRWRGRDGAAEHRHADHVHGRHEQLRDRFDELREPGARRCPAESV